MLKLIVNGRSREVEEGTVVDLLRGHGLDNKMVVVEIDGSIVPKEAWASTALADGMTVELVHFVGGG
ncbi:sulfur carrier protein ThiS [Paenibacillus flagellatus]|uniref:Thiamine biosynthesis protein ThiS n=1 Tax=Paenibacillus flagellatus TaxID=2211139 RepID=A0A2V5K6S5_9BACL|nr:sulfur carrier protein ThiS [Paenibacillus flagellatus]PYI55101.1 thiamine biosynthesis protein ThiS [Paenibacillus flagellatus]